MHPHNESANANGTSRPDRHELFDSCRLWAYRYANNYIRRHGVFKGCQRADVWQSALLGLWEATEKYDPSKGSLTTIASYYMLKHINQLKSVADGSIARKPPVSLEKCGEPRTEDHGADLIDDLDRFDMELGKLHGVFDRLSDVVRDILLDFANGVRRGETEKRLNMNHMTLTRFRRIGLLWLRYWIGINTSPPDDPLPSGWTPRSELVHGRAHGRAEYNGANPHASD